jgi:hypothetical protein
MGTPEYGSLANAVLGDVADIRYEVWHEAHRLRCRSTPQPLLSPFCLACSYLA